MNFQQVEKLKGLIQKSPILTPAERDEWLLLLDLMNDKQLLELEKILTGAKPAPSPVAAPPISQPLVAKFPPRPAMAAATEQPVYLGHIINMPKISSLEESGKLPAAGIAQEADKAKGFLARLKLILGEKELPPGHEEAAKELELTPGKATPPRGTPKIPSGFLGNSRPRPPLVRGGTEGQIKHPPVVPHPPRLRESETGPKPKTVLPSIKQVPQVSKPQPMASIQNLYPHLKVGPQPISGKPIVQRQPESAKELPAKLADILAQSKSFPAKVPAAAPPAAASKPAQDFENFAGFKTPLQPAAKLAEEFEAKGLEKLPSFKGAFAAAQLKSELKETKEVKESKESRPQTLKDLMALTPAKFSESNDSLIASLKQLVKDFGFYEVIFNLEKSPLFQAYLETGLNILSGKAGFDSQAEPVDKRFLSRAQFEQFVDFLRKIQAG
jgi:hypothetical protein